MNVQGLRIVAQVAMDAFYQSFKPNDAFLRLEHFLFLCKAADGKLKQDEYDKQVRLNLQKGARNAPVFLSSGNYVTETPEIKEGKAILTHNILTFSGASQTVSVSRVKLNGGCDNIMPITQEEAWQACDIKHVVFWMPICNGIEFLNLEGNCKPEKATITYVPELTDDSTIPENRKFMILNMVNAYIKSAQQGTIIDMNNDGNTNVATQTEINKYVLKALQKQ